MYSRSKKFVTHPALLAGDSRDGNTARNSDVTAIRHLVVTPIVGVFRKWGLGDDRLVAPSG